MNRAINEQLEGIIDRLDEEPITLGMVGMAAGAYIGGRVLGKAVATGGRAAVRKMQKMLKKHGEKAGTTHTRADGKYTKQADGSWKKTG